MQFTEGIVHRVAGFPVRQSGNSAAASFCGSHSSCNNSLLTLCPPADLAARHNQFSPDVRQPESERLHAIPHHHRAFRSIHSSAAVPDASSAASLATMPHGPFHPTYEPTGLAQLQLYAFKLLAAFGIHQRHHNFEIGYVWRKSWAVFRKSALSISTLHHGCPATMPDSGHRKGSPDITGTIFIWI